MEMLAFHDIKMHGNGQIGKKGCRQKMGMSGKSADIDVSARHIADMSPTFPTKHLMGVKQNQKQSHCLHHSQSGRCHVAAMSLTGDKESSNPMSFLGRER
jgi:hypothetical protein